jgi:hypothetical protein
MDPNTQRLLASSGGAAERLYVEDVFSTWLYTGNGSTQTITNGIDLSGKGGLVWIKSRSIGSGHVLVDTDRGSPNVIQSSNTNAQVNYTDEFGSFLSTGFTVPNNTTYGETNTPARTYASWTFRKAEKFFDVVTYTGNGSNRTIAHNLGSVPGCIIVKCTSASDNWQVYHRSLGATKFLNLDASNTAGTNSNRWNNTEPTSSLFTVGTGAGVNGSGLTYVAYLFAHDAGGFGDSGSDSVVKCGIYSGSTPVNLGWEPQWVLIKPSSTSATDWYVFDNMRGFPAGSGARHLNPNLTAAEDAGGNFQITSTGFVDNWLGYSNTIYIAIRRGPMKTPTSGTEVFKALTRTGTGTAGFVSGVGFAPDFLINKEPARVFTCCDWFYDKLRSPEYWLNSTTSNGESSGNSAPLLFTNDGLQLTSGIRANYSGALQLDYYFRRAPGYFDVVAYTGTGSARTVSHNLSVVPELMIVKSRSATTPWRIYAGPIFGNTSADCLVFDNSSANFSNSIFNSTNPTSSVFTVGGSGVGTNDSSATYIAYLFATLTGVSKVGSYTGTGTTKDIDCGFTAGARFVLIKRIDSTGDWYVWDTARGIVSGNDSYFLLNSDTAEVTNTDYIDPLSSGFQISSTAPAAINANGGSFIFLAIS